MEARTMKRILVRLLSNGFRRQVQIFGIALQLKSSALLLYGRRTKVTGSGSPALKRDQAIVLRTRGLS